MSSFTSVRKFRHTLHDSCRVSRHLEQRDGITTFHLVLYWSGADYNIIPPNFVLVFKSSNTPQFIRHCRFARRLARRRIVMSVDL
jgi:hypothetical protein